MSHYYDEDEARRMSRRIAAEFEATYGTLDEKVSRVPEEAAQAIADKCGVHIEVARVAYRVMLDGIVTDPESCCQLLMNEFNRRAEIGQPVPEIDTYIREVALTEGKWVEYLYGQLGKVLLQDLRNLANLTRSVADEIEPAAEHVIAVIGQRRQVAESFFTSLISRWLTDHEDATIVDVIRAITGGLLGPVTDIDDAINGARASLLIKFRRYEQFLVTKDEEESKLLEKVRGELQFFIKEIQGPLNHVSEKTAGEILIEVLPPPPESIGDKPKYGFVHSAFPTQARAGPPLKSPLDFLERDVWLAIMQPPSKRAGFLSEKIASTMNNLIDQGTPLDKLGTTIIFDLDNRFPWKKSKKTEVRRELKEIQETAGEDYRSEIEGYVLETLLAKIPQLRSSPPSSEE